MIPALYVRLDALPLSPSGKVDRKALEEQAAGVSGRSREHVAPETPLERLLVRIWEDVLDHRPVGLHDDFFALGGNSLHVMQVTGALRDLFRREVPADQVFLAATTAGLVATLFPGEAERRAAEAVAESVLG